MNFEGARTLIDELHRENRITNNEYNILRDCIDKAENKIETLLPLVQYHIDELLEIRTEELLKYRNFTFSAISKAYMSNKSDKEFREWFKDEYDKQICSK